MRIISGSLKGRKLTSLKGTQTRPTADRVREALFGILGTRIIDAAVLDLYAGTGALGIEAISRGARWAVFIDDHLQALATLRKNIDQCGLQDRCTVFRRDITRNLNCLKIYQGKFDIVFIDPPYHQDRVAPALDWLVRLRLLTDHAVVVAEHAANECIRPPADLICQDRRTYGQTGISFFEHPLDTAPPV